MRRGGKRLEQALTVFVEDLRGNLAFIPASPYRELNAWLLDDPRSREAWLQLCGLKGLARMTVGMLDGLLSRSEWEQLLPHASVITTQHVHEIVSDNVSIGLAHRCEPDPTYGARRELVLHFNRAMIARLRGEVASTEEALAAARPYAAGISILDQNLSPAKHRELASAYLGHSGGSLVDFEGSVLQALHASIEASVAVARHARAFAVAEHVREGLIARYQGVNDLLLEPGLSLDLRIEASTRTIMVVPTLAYHCGFLAEVVRPMAAFRAVVSDGTIPRVWRAAALLVRLLNDVGPLLLDLDSDQRGELVAELRDLGRSGAYRTFDELLRATLHARSGVLTRIRKDVLMGEPNVTLRDRGAPAADAVAWFGEDVAELSGLYHRTRAELAAGLGVIAARLRDDLLARVVERFVGFYEALYRQEFDDPAGEVAV